ncbi:MAG: DNA-processing protein DprA [Acidimicrobiaceae bacterium]|nr:DNA-processing protein DprA [Acidimicrobiaceae bacterium]MXW77319.1 DNA-processing protein DprA [Acidimicrobiaceae bacterium]MYC41252.1 DNA-processing protein DprA [Acidimicrobiaceae bacterium]MYD08079.1 DNA-processing protein DprA [Acidimicrobiaceae bacterium]MYI57374.1 DNA-processing protein DprA [Acidimicrobiaceae bacterium]
MREDAYAAALGGLSGATPLRLHNLLRSRSAREALRAIESASIGTEVAPPDVLAEWQREISRLDLPSVSARLDELDARVSTLHERIHPPQLTNDIDPAPLLFCRGRLPDPSLVHVAVVGTRRASAIGREVARELGFGLAQAGVVVVSGLALGIDGEAHRGALLAAAVPPLAVVGSGVDVVYPKRHSDIWEDVASVGALVSEAPLGAPPEPWRFPARNRLIAAFSDLLVVVESRDSGGSLLTVEQALRRDIEVMAVPGSVRNKAAGGTNQLLVDGSAPARDVTDVLVALGLSEIAVAARRNEHEVNAPDSPVGTRASPAHSAAGIGDSAAVVGRTAVVLDAIDDGPTSVDEVVDRSGLGVIEVYGLVEELVAMGLVVHDGSRVRRQH